MSPARQANGSPGRSQPTRPTSINRISRTARNAAGPSPVAKRQRDFDPHSFLATIGAGRSSKGSEETGDLRAGGCG